MNGCMFVHSDPQAVFRSPYLLAPAVPGASIAFEKFDPAEVSRREEVGQIGQVLPLSEVVTFVPQLPRDAMRLTTTEEHAGTTGVVTGRVIARGDLGDTELRIVPTRGMGR